MLYSYKLPLQFDPERLKRDLTQFLETDWVPHFNKSYYEGDWSGIVLRNPGGKSQTLFTGAPGVQDFAFTPLVERTPYLREVIATFECPVKSVRLLRLSAGSVVREHRDPDLDFATGDIRIHIPVQTNPHLEFYLHNRRLFLKEGEAWFLQLCEPHRLYNGGTAPRIHLVIDLGVNDWVKNLIPFDFHKEEPLPWEEKEVDSDTAKTNLQEFCRLVKANIEIQKELRDIFDQTLFIEELQRVAFENGLPLGKDHIRESLRSERALWLQRWIS
jgi:hypothetical protein